MSGEAPDKPADQPRGSSAARGFPGSPRWLNIRRGFKELVIVFSGVYAAFILNRFDSERHDAQRRVQILDALEREVSANVDDLKQDVAQGEAVYSAFDRSLAAGEMPPLFIASVNTGYSASDDATLLQAGGIQLLDVQTLDLLRKVNALERALISITHDQFELGLTMLANHEKEEFYDSVTHRLKPRYAWYPDTHHAVLAQAKELLADEEALLASIRSRQRADGGRK